MLKSILVLTYLLDPAIGFQTPIIGSRKPILLGTDSSVTSGGSNVELWLDLRGTRIFPSTALDRLEEDFGISSIVDRVILWDDGNDNNRGAEENKIFLDGSNGDLSSRSPGFSGKLISLAEGEFTDPMPALETISQGGWVLIDTMSISDGQARVSAVTCLVELLLVAGSAGGSTGAFVLGEKKDESDSLFEMGGIAWTCPTRADVFHAAATLQSLLSSSTTTQSGILVANSLSEASDSIRLRSAIVLPFDGPWEAALLVFRSKEY